jgi:phage-related tail fiber protein
VTTSPRTLDDLYAIKDPTERALAATAYLERIEKATRAAHAARLDAIRELLEANGRRDWHRPAVIAKAVGMSVSTVKVVRSAIESERDEP